MKVKIVVGGWMNTPFEWSNAFWLLLRWVILIPIDSECCRLNIQITSQFITFHHSRLTHTNEPTTFITHLLPLKSYSLKYIEYYHINKKKLAEQFMAVKNSAQLCHLDPYFSSFYLISHQALYTKLPSIMNFLVEPIKSVLQNSEITCHRIQKSVKTSVRMY